MHTLAQFAIIALCSEVQKFGARGTERDQNNANHTERGNTVYSLCGIPESIGPYVCDCVMVLLSCAPEVMLMQLKLLIGQSYGENFERKFYLIRENEIRDMRDLRWKYS